MSRGWRFGFLLLSATLPVLFQARGWAAAPDAPDCKTLWDRVALRMEHEYCAWQAGQGDGPAKRLEETRKHAYEVPYDAIPDAALKKRIVELLGKEPKASNVVLISRVPPDWLAPLAVGRDIQAGGGGPTVVDRIIMMCTVGGKRKGHYELSGAAWGVTQWRRKPGVEFIALASREADSFLWNDPVAHAQTPNAVDAPIPGDPTKAMADFRAYVQDRAKEVVQACRAAQPQPLQAAYALSFLLHAVQDLATHAGRTNAEHSYNAHSDQNPDGDQKLLMRAQTWSSDVVKLFDAELPPSCLELVSGLDAAADLKKIGKAHFGRDPDGTPLALWDYHLLGSRYADQFVAQEKRRGRKSNLLVRWFDERNDDAAQAFFDSHVLTVIRRVLGNQANQTKWKD